MPLYRYSALSPTGQEVAGHLEGPSAGWVSERLASDSMIPLEIEPDAGPTRLTDQLQRLLPVGIGDLSLFSSLLSFMLEAGLPLMASLDLLAENALKARMADAIRSAATAIREGGTLHGALSGTGLFPKVFLSMVRAGEAGGALPEVMRQLAAYLDRESELRGRLKGALVYPAFLLILSFCIVTFLMVAIIPKFIEILERLKVELPLPTRILVAISEFLTGQWIILLALIVVAGGGIAYLWSREDVRHWADNTVLKIPLLGDLVSKSSLARFSYVMGSLLSRGIPIIDALNVAQETTGNRRMAEAMGQTRQRIVGGAGISEALASTGLMPALVQQMVSIGEATGNLDQVLMRISDIYDEQVDRATDALIRLAEPVLILFLGLVVGFIALSLVMPMVAAVTSMGG